MDIHKTVKKNNRFGLTKVKLEMQSILCHELLVCANIIFPRFPVRYEYSIKVYAVSFLKARKKSLLSKKRIRKIVEKTAVSTSLIINYLLNSD